MGIGSPRASTVEAFTRARPLPDPGARSARRFFRGILLAVALGTVGWGLLAALGFAVYLLIS
jgi:hypothetical protein